jgi:cytochrome c peroxidase
VVDAPFDRKEGDEPALNDAEIADAIAFLKKADDETLHHTGASQMSPLERSRRR